MGTVRLALLTETSGGALLTLSQLPLAAMQAAGQHRRLAWGACDRTKV
jgi:hypothetical protein